MAPPRIWTEEMVTRLAGLIATGMTAKEAGWVMGCSKNAIIGKCSREGIALNGKRPAPKKPGKAPYAGSIKLTRKQRLASVRAGFVQAIQDGRITPGGSTMGTDLRNPVPGVA